MPSHTFQYIPGFYISTSDLSGKNEIVATYSPTGYGWEWRKECKTVHAAKLAITRYQRERVARLWDEADEFTRAYIGAALWSSVDDDDTPLDTNYDWQDIALPTLEKMIAECREFQTTHSGLLALAYTMYNISEEHSAQERAGHDFWLTRNRHGVGFWDRLELGEIGDKLTDAAHASGARDLYVHNGKIYQYQ